MIWEAGCPDPIILLSFRLNVLKEHINFFRTQASDLSLKSLNHFEELEIENLKQTLSLHLSGCQQCALQADVSLGWFGEMKQKIIGDRLSTYVNPLEANCQDKDDCLIFIAQMQVGTYLEIECPILPELATEAFLSPHPTLTQLLIREHLLRCDFCRTFWFQQQKRKN
jgi:hypothetical protein